MITKDIKYGISEGVTLVEFGDGDIIVADAYTVDRKQYGVMMTNDEKREIGTEHPERDGATTDQIGIDVAILFTDLKSLNVFIEALKRVEQVMIANNVNNIKG